MSPHLLNRYYYHPCIGEKATLPIGIISKGMANLSTLAITGFLIAIYDRVINIWNIRKNLFPSS